MPDPGDQAQIRVLIVDDDSVDRRAVRRALPKAFTVIEAENGDQALRIVRADPPHCVLLDYQIPGTDTFRLLTDLSGRVPVVMLTGQGDEAVAAEIMKAGALDYLNKNAFTTELLERSVRLAMEKMARRREREESRQRLVSDYQQEKRKREQLEAGLQVAHDIQSKLIPTAPPDLPGFDVAGVSFPAEAAGGDFYDHFRLADGRIAIAVADVSGHGIGPALIAAETRAFTLALACTHADVGTIATMLNRLLCADLTEEFVTFFLVGINLEEQSLTYAAAGHEAYLLTNSGLVTKLESTGYPLGISRDAPVLAKGPFPMRSADVLLLATDGLMDMNAPDGTFFGKERCFQIIQDHRHEPAERIVDRLVYAVRSFAQGEPQPDDITIVIVRKI